MKKPVVIIGIGEMGGVFARGFLRAGFPLIPVTRDMSLAAAGRETPDPACVLVAVAENDLQPTLKAIPDAWKDRICLLQNELLPAHWAAHDFTDPTVISVWFEKKRGQDVKVLIPSPAFGPAATLLSTALDAIDIPVRVLETSDELLFELVRKNVYILTTNIAGLEAGGTVSELWSDYRDLAKAVAADVIDLQETLTAKRFERDALMNAVLEAFDGDPDHKCMGRSAPARLQRALETAGTCSLRLPTLSAMKKHLQ